MCQGINVLPQLQPEHIELELWCVGVGGVTHKVLLIKALAYVRELRVQLAHVIAVGVDVDEVHVGGWHIQHVQVLSQLL